MQTKKNRRCFPIQKNKKGLRKWLIHLRTNFNIFCVFWQVMSEKSINKTHQSSCITEASKIARVSRLAIKKFIFSISDVEHMSCIFWPLPLKGLLRIHNS